MNSDKIEADPGSDSDAESDSEFEGMFGGKFLDALYLKLRAGMREGGGGEMGEGSGGSGGVTGRER